MVAQTDMRAAARVAAPRGATPLLAFIAGEFAASAAHVWPAPHADYFVLPAARRHAAAIALAGYAARSVAPSDLRRILTYERDTVVAEMLTGGPAPGLMRALAKAGETIWPRRAYRTFLELLQEPAAAEVLRHMDQVRPEAFDPLAALPPALRAAALLRAIPAERAAEDLALAFRLAVRMRGAEAAPRLARSWTSGGDTSALFRRAVDDLTPDAFVPGQPAPALGPDFARIGTRRQLEQTALAMRNCLVDHAQRIAEGRMAVFLWRFGDVEAAIALMRDAAGWRLAEAKVADNNDLDEPRLRDLVARLDAVGVRTGPSVQKLAQRLDDWASGATYYLNHSTDFIGRLELGDIWS